MTTPLNIPSELMDIAIAIILITVLFITITFRRWMFKYRSPDNSNSPVLFSYFSRGNDLFAVDRHEVPLIEGGAACTRMVTMPRPASQEEKELAVPAGKAILLVELPFYSKLHLLAISRDAALDQLDPTYGGSIMERAELEGDFQDFFSIYIDKGQQLQLRYVFDPEAMEYVIDFCHKYHWEIVDDIIYFASKVTLPTDEMVAEFIKQIRPALESKDIVPLRPSQPKKEIWPRPSSFKCPVCKQTMKQYKHWHECPSGHGQLIIGGFLTDPETKQEFLSEEGNTKQVSVEHQNITCPACGKPMTPVQYGYSEMFIDACTACYYRWLDGGELKRVFDRPHY